MFALKKLNVASVSAHKVTYTVFPNLLKVPLRKSFQKKLVFIPNRSIYGLSRVSPFSSTHVMLERAKKGKGKNSKLDWSFEDADVDDYDKGSKQKNKKGGKAANTSRSEEFDIAPTFDSMDKVLSSLVEELKSIKIGRADPSLLHNITVDGENINRLGQVQVKDPFTLSIALYDTNNIQKVIKVIQSVNPTLNPNHDGQNIYLSVPRPTPEYKKGLLKKVATLSENAKTNIRNTRRDVNAKIKKSNYPKDDEKTAEKQVQMAHDEFIKKIDKTVSQKEQELNK